MKINIKNIKSKISKIKLPKVNLLDGQERGEIIFRRIFVLIVGALLIYLFLLVVVGKKEDRIEPAQASERSGLNTGDTVNGQEVWLDEDGKVWFIQEAIEAPEIEKATEKVSTHQSAQLEAIEGFVGSYRGSRIDGAYLDLLANECSDEALRIVVAISVSESGMGRDLPNRQSNFWGWFKGNKRNYDPSREQMAKDICKGVEDHYMDLGTNMKSVARYTGNDRPTSWYNNFMWAMSQMESR